MYPRPDKALAEALRVLAAGAGRVRVSRLGRCRPRTFAWQLLFDAIREHGDPAAAKDRRHRAAISARRRRYLRLLGDAGFAAAQAEPVCPRMVHRRIRAISSARWRKGRSRTAALIAAQAPSRRARQSKRAVCQRPRWPYRRRRRLCGADRGDPGMPAPNRRHEPDLATDIPDRRGRRRRHGMPQIARGAPTGCRARAAGRQEPRRPAAGATIMAQMTVGGGAR